MERLKRLQTFFQEIDLGPEETSGGIMLRYKAVSNFDSEDRIGAYLSFLASKKLLEGETLSEQVVEDVAFQFALTLPAARERVAAWLAKRTEATVTDPETKETAAL